MAKRSITGAIVLSSEKAVEYFDQLANNGMLLEMISILIEREASGVSHESLLVKLDDISKKLDGLRATSTHFSSVSEVSPEISKEGEETPKTAKVVTATVAKSATGLLDRFSSMRRN